jgi:hypothetical protein
MGGDGHCLGCASQGLGWTCAGLAMARLDMIWAGQWKVWTWPWVGLAMGCADHVLKWPCVGLAICRAGHALAWSRASLAMRWTAQECAGLGWV